MEDNSYEVEERFYCHGCRQVIENNDHGLAIIFLDKISNKVVSGLDFVHMSDSCKQLVIGSPRGNWSANCKSKYISLPDFRRFNRGVAGAWYDPRYERVDVTDYAWLVPGGFTKRTQRAYKEKVISQEEYDYLCAEELLDDESTNKCHEIMLKMGLLRRIA